MKLSWARRCRGFGDLAWQRFHKRELDEIIKNTTLAERFDCINCQNNWMVYPDAQGRWPLGIECERCHTHYKLNLSEISRQRSEPQNTHDDFEEMLRPQRELEEAMRRRAETLLQKDPIDQARESAFKGME